MERRLAALKEEMGLLPAGGAEPVGEVKEAEIIDHEEAAEEAAEEDEEDKAD